MIYLNQIYIISLSYTPAISLKNDFHEKNDFFDVLTKKSPSN